MTLRPLSLIAPLALLVLGACELGNNPPQAPEAATPAAPPVTAEGPFAVTNDGVGGLGVDSKLFIADIEKAFPGSRAIETYVDGPTIVAVLSVSGEHDLSMDVIPANGSNTIGAIVVRGGPVVGPGGGKIKGKLAEAGVTADQCSPGKGRYKGKQVCAPAGAPRVSYIASGGVIREIYWSSGNEAVGVASPRPIQMQVAR